jgi:hypothetical protein
LRSYPFLFWCCKDSQLMTSCKFFLKNIPHTLLFSNNIYC